MLDFPTRTVLEVLGLKVSPTVLIGSANLSLQGIDLAVADIDFLTDDRGVQAFARELGGSPAAPNGFLEFWAERDGVTVNFTSFEGNPLRQTVTESATDLVERDGAILPCLCLESELAFYGRAGRPKDGIKADLIRRRLENIRKGVT